MRFRKILKMIPSDYRKQGIKVTFSVLVRALLNFAGLAVLIPVLILILNPETIDSHSFLGSFRLRMHIGDDTTFVVAVCAIVLVFILAKNILIQLLGNSQVKYVNSLYRYFSYKLYDSYFRKGLLFIKQNHTTSLSHKINGVCFSFAQGVLSLSLTMAGEMILLILIVIALLLYSFKAALFSIGCLLPMVWIYFYAVRKKLVQYGRAENEVRRAQARTVSETFKGYAEVRIYDAFAWFQKRFQDGLQQISHYRESTDRIMRIPGTAMEFLVAVGLVALVLLSRENNSLKLSFGIFALAALRILPAVRTVITGWTQLKNNAYSADVIEEALASSQSENVGTSLRGGTTKQSKKYWIASGKALAMTDEQHSPESTPLSFRNEIKIDNISFSYFDPDGREIPVFRDFSMTIRKGDKIGIQGLSGQGKTTLFNLLLGFYTPQKGKIWIDETPLDESNVEQWHKLVAYVPQDVFILDGTLSENIAFGKDRIDRDRIQMALEYARLDDFVSSLPEGLDTRLGESGNRLSGGQRQRIGIARALYKDPEILFFDEATSSLDKKTENEITETIRKLSAEKDERTILIISHHGSIVKFCNTIINIES